MFPNSVSNRLSRLIVDSCFSVDEVDSWIADASRQLGGLHWRHVGWNSHEPEINNAGTCEVANDKRAPVAEIFFNSNDAVIHLAHLMTGFKATSPHAAVASCDLFSPGPKSWSHSMIGMTLHDSGNPARPTLDIRDRGHGQHPDDFRNTFLSLHSSTKLSLPHLCGKFGMGMKSAFKFCERLIIVSKPHRLVLKGRSPRIGFSIVRRNFTEGEKAFHYDYLCDAQGQVLRLEMPDDSFGHGTLIRLVGYDLEGYSGGISKQNNSLRLMMNSYAIDPPVGATISDRRGKSKENMTLRGLLYTLENPKTPNSHEDSFVVKVDFGGSESNVLVRYFVLHSKESPHDKSGTKVKAEQGITFSHNGQRHGVESRLLFKTRFNLAAIYPRMVAVVDTSGLNPAACSDLYSSNRIGVDCHSKVYESIMSALEAHLEGDEDLQALDEEAMRSKSDNRAALTESLEKAVSEMVAGIIGRRRAAGGSSSGVAKGGGNRGRRNRDDSGLNDLPTRVVVENSPFVAPQGRFAYLTLDIDAKNGYVKPGDGKVSVSFLNGARVRSEGMLIGGKLRLVVDVPESCRKEQTEFKVSLEDKENSISLSAKGVMKVVEPKVGKPGRGNKKQGGGEKFVGPDALVSWVMKEDWEQAGADKWNADFPGECSIKRQNGEVYLVSFNLNADFFALESIRQSLSGKEESSYDSRRDEYGKALCSALLHKELNSMSAETSFSIALAEAIFGPPKKASKPGAVKEGTAPSSIVTDLAPGGRSVLGSSTFAAETAAANSHQA